MSPGKLLLLACAVQYSLVQWRLVQSALDVALSGYQCPPQPCADCLPLPLVRSSVSALEDTCSPLVDWWSVLQAISTGQAGKATRVIHPIISKAIFTPVGPGVLLLTSERTTISYLCQSLPKAAAGQVEILWIFSLMLFFWGQAHEFLKVVMVFQRFHIQEAKKCKVIMSFWRSVVYWWEVCSQLCFPQKWHTW